MACNCGSCNTRRDKWVDEKMRQESNPPNFIISNPSSMYSWTHTPLPAVLRTVCGCEKVINIPHQLNEISMQVLDEAPMRVQYELQNQGIFTRDLDSGTVPDNVRTRLRTFRFDRRLSDGRLLYIEDVRSTDTVMIREFRKSVIEKDKMLKESRSSAAYYRHALAQANQRSGCFETRLVAQSKEVKELRSSVAYYRFKLAQANKQIREAKRALK